MYSMYFVAVTPLFQLLTKYGSAALPSKRFVNKHCKHVNDLSIYYSSTTPRPNHYYKMFLLFNIRAKTNHIDTYVVQGPLHYLCTNSLPNIGILMQFNSFINIS